MTLFRLVSFFEELADLLKQEAPLLLLPVLQGRVYEDTRQDVPWKPWCGEGLPYKKVPMAWTRHRSANTVKAMYLGRLDLPHISPAHQQGAHKMAAPSKGRSRS